jgi:hypothetical protein
MRKILKKSLILMFALISTLIFGSRIFNINFQPTAQDNFGVFSDHTFDSLPTPDLPDEVYISYTDFRSDIGDISANIVAINPATWGKIIRIDTAEELYRFSIDVSYKFKYTIYETKLTPEAIETLLSFDYVLGNDIDYSVMKSKQFNPIGFNFEIEGITYQQAFKGTFDGHGFEIKNLYFSGYNQLTEVLNLGTEFETTVAYVEYYAMFAYNEGTIQNFGMIDPTFEFNFENETLFKAANIVGLNSETGNVNHVYAIDTRLSALVAGIRMVAAAGQAAGILFDNYGTFNNAYYASRVVMNASYGSRFTVQPVLFTNHPSGTYSNLAFDDTLYQETVLISGSTYNITTPNAYQTSMTTAQLRSSNAVLGTGWFYYPAENDPTPKYPSLLGLTRITGSLDIELSETAGDDVTVTNYFIIEDALDIIAFSKMLNYTRESNQTPFRELSYVLMDNVDMSVVASDAYKTPTVEFSGIFAGISNEVYIYGINITNGIVQQNYYSGMFGILSGQVYNLLFYDAGITLNETDDFSSAPTYVGLIAGQLVDGIIRNVLVDVDIDLGHDTLGELHVGAIVGSASGNVSGIYAEGNIFGNNDHVFRSDIVINPTYYFGGLIGSSGATQLVLTDAYNHVAVHGFGTVSTTITSSTAPTIYLGGVIGKVTNTADVTHVIGLLTNEGELLVSEIITSFSEVQYVGGVIGMSAGTAYVLNSTFGNFTNKGNINLVNNGTNSIISAGVLVSNHSAAVEFVHIFNEATGTLEYYTVSQPSGTIVGDFTNILYTTLIYNVGSSLTLSQAQNDADITIVGSYNYSGVYHSSTNAQTILRFVENDGDILFQNQSLAQTTSFAGISLSLNINYLNVTYDGSIHILSITMQSTNTVQEQLYVAGITQTLTSGKYIKNGLVNGEIIVAGIISNQSNFTAANNIFIGGFVNFNNSGNMDPNGTLDMPVATIGIINSINNAEITSRYSPSISGISGHANVYVGGIATLNDGDIQDSANMGDIRFENTSNVDTANVTFNTDATTAGSTTKYRYGTVLGGVAGAVVSQKSRIYDSSNSGTIIGLSKNFSRVGGILGLSIFRELLYGNVVTAYGSAGAADIWDSILSNCINYGDVSALTITISNYSNTSLYVTMSSGITNPFRFDITQPVLVPSYNSTFYSALTSGSVRAYTRTSSEERPGINASAGGVIGYGLSVMRRMMNHGQISSTDVAGGVVGATVVIDTSQYVKIDTAINYGTVRAFDRGTVGDNYANFNSVDIMDYETIRDHFYAVDSTFMFPETHSDIRLFPENKRGIGGIFGRLQRGSGLVMYGNNDANSTFNFIVNMDPNVDLIGRLDQVTNYYSSLRFYDFENAVYYSARKNDTTQIIFTGVTYFYDNSSNSGNSLYATRTSTNITIQSRKYEYSYDGGTEQWLRTTYTQTKARTEVSLYGRKYTRYGYDEADYENYQTEIISRSAAPAHDASGWVALAGSTIAVGTIDEYKYETDLPLYNQVWDVDSTKVTGTSSTTQVPNGYYMFGTSIPVPIITEEAGDPQGQYVYSPTFEMQTDTILQQYIYYAENGNLSPTFIDSRPNGMYVLSTSSGSTFGSVLPANMKFDQLLPLASGVNGELPPFDVDYSAGTRIIPSEDPTYGILLSDYEELFQTMYSDKSALLEDTETTLELDEIDGSMTMLLNPTVVDPTDLNPLGVITFNLNLNTLDFDVNGLSTVDYEIFGAMLPKDAILARTIEDYYGLAYGSNISAYISDFRLLLADYANPLIDPLNKPDLSPVFSYTFDLNNLTTGLITIGYFTSYSQVSQNFTSFLNDNYITDYQVRLNVSYNPSSTMPFLYSYQIDGGTVRTTIVTNITAEAVDTLLTFNFRDPSFILPLGTNVLEIGTDNADNITLEYFDPNTSTYVMVDYADYSRTSTLVSTATNHPFSFTIGVNTSLKAGLYRLGFKLLPYEETRDYYTFTKGSSTLRTILDVEHYSSGVVAPSGTTINSYVNFGYEFDWSSTTVTEVPIIGAKAYQKTASNYTLPFLTSIRIADFATITNVVINETTYQANGFRIYHVSYTVTSESGASTTYVHNISERAISIKDVYRNNNKVVMNSSNPVIITREAFSTAVSVNYGIDPLLARDLYNLIDDNPESYFSITPASVTGITYSVTDTYLVFTIDSSAAAGDYQFTIGYYRTGETIISLGIVYITKSEGQNAYLSDIQFSELATETNYAIINESNSLGVIVTSLYDPTIYYAGIDYDGADVNGVTNFRVDGQVSNIPIDEYIPYFLNYLPLGATIAKKGTGGVYTAEVTGPEDTNVYLLAADFTASEETENDDIIITYRVTSESGLNVVYYHITVTDITYNVSFIFDVIYVGNTLQPDLDGAVIVINVRNMSTNLPVGDSLVTVFPAFTQINSYNNSTNLLYMVDNEDYKFRFGRNKSGYFSFNVSVLDPDGYEYDYTIELNGTDLLADINSYDLDSNDQGKYYYINSSTKNRTRYFTITIFDAKVPNRDYGFVDKDKSW